MPKSLRSQAEPDPGSPHIGLLNEKPLHAGLKSYCAQPGDRFEERVDGYVIDIVREGLLLEIQTKSFGAIRTKLQRLLRQHRIRLVYPVARDKWIVKLAQGRESRNTRRKSPRRGQVEDVFWELVSCPQVMANPNFSLQVVLIQEDELRRYAGKRHWRRRGWITEERRLLDVVDQQLFQGPGDWRALLPSGLAETFTTRNLAEAAGIRRPLAQKMAYCFREAGLIELVGNEGRALLYRWVR